MTLAGQTREQAGPNIFLRLAIALAALAAIAGLLALVAMLLPAAPPPAPARTPFGLGLREAAPQAGGIGGLILAWQSQFYRALTAALGALKTDGGIAGLIGLSFAYGIFHAAGPGHGKGVIAAYLIADGRQWLRGFSLALAAALVQALVAIALVGVLALVLNATAMTITATTRWIEMLSFAAVAALGLWLVWRQAGRVAHAWKGAPAEACAHTHLPGPEALARIRDWRETAAVVLAAGLRPCTGAIVVLVFAMAQGLLAAGITATFAMALGTALTTGALAALAVGAKRLALALAGGRGDLGRKTALVLELLAAAFVLTLGIALLMGLWTSAQPG